MLFYLGFAVIDFGLRGNYFQLYLRGLMGNKSQILLLCVLLWFECPFNEL